MGQAADGSFSAQAGPGVTAIVATSILSQGRSPEDPVVAKSLQYLEKFIQPDGGIYEPKNFFNNYETSIALMAFSAANKAGKNEKFAKIVKDAEKFLKEIQWDEQKSQDQTYYGGAGYGSHKRPDLSNTQFLMDALKAAGAGPDDPAVKKALVFVSRCQNLETEHNTLPFAAKNPDGGFYYTPAAGGTSQAGDPLPGGGLRSYGSMTYAGLKSMIYAGVGPDDPRVKAAIKWLQMHYDLKSNPGMPTDKKHQGLYYYYHTMAKALDAVGKPEFVDDQGVTHDWRAELAAELIARQKADGSWINDADRWMEGDPNLVTAYSLLALSYCRPAAK
jgi:squalene-hopene/tetraprenyl-beta-curcumene cyclase